MEINDKIDKYPKLLKDYNVNFIDNEVVYKELNKEQEKILANTLEKFFNAVFTQSFEQFLRKQDIKQEDYDDDSLFQKKKICYAIEQLRYSPVALNEKYYTGYYYGCGFFTVSLTTGLLLARYFKKRI